MTQTTTADSTTENWKPVSMLVWLTQTAKETLVRDTGNISFIKGTANCKQNNKTRDLSANSGL
jgi:hypothetical protein